MDYGCICILVAGSSFPPIYYEFACKEVYISRLFYLGLITSSSTACFIVLLVPKFAQPEYRPCRAFMFIFLGLSAAIPFIYIGYLHGTPDSKYILPKYHHWPWLIGGFVYIGGALIYAARVPERFSPKTFDLIGSSH